MMRKDRLLLGRLAVQSSSSLNAHSSLLLLKVIQRWSTSLNDRAILFGALLVIYQHFKSKQITLV